ncbi:secretion protein [Paraburkholderia nemoris]|uniref:secretion protein n=1 Tax=Paraburkholderia nemoris TaxID=2793076 RepID=UPI0038BB73B9
MKLLRILTGVHAGVELHLGAGAHRIGSDNDADIRISDWSGADVLLTVDDTGVVGAQRLLPELQALAQPEAQQTLANDGAETMDPGTVLLIDFVPMRFDDKVLCVGADDAVWPSDLDLLSTLLVKPHEARHEAERSRQRKLVGAVLGCAMLGAVVVIGSVLITTVVSRAALPRDSGDLAQRVNRALAQAHMGELHARPHGNNVIVSGMVPTPEDDATVRRVLTQLSSTAIKRQYDIAQNDARDIEDALGAQRVHVAYAGQGAFDITGKVADPANVEAALTRIRHDLSANVKELRMQLTQSNDSAPPPPSFSELMSSDDVRYAETPDGIKHIYVDPEIADAPASDASFGAAAGVDGASGAQATAQPGAASGVAQAAAGQPNAARGVAQSVGGAAAPAAVASTFLPLPK